MRVVLAFAGFLLACHRNGVESPVPDLDALSSRLEALRREYAIPALSAGIVNANQTTWVKGFGSTSATGDLPPTPQSVFHLASLTKTFASAIILQLAAEGKLSLDDNVGRYGVHFGNSNGILVRHLMSHTSEGTPGERFQYSGDRYAQLDRVIESATGKSFAQLAVERIIGPLKLTCTGPSTDPVLRAALVPGHNHNRQVIAYPPSFSSAAGMLSCMQDLLIYSAAWDSDALLSASGRQSAWTAAVNSAQVKLPHGLGWFVDEFDGKTIVWHYGLWTGISALIVKLPDQRISFVLLANNDQLSSSFRLGSGDLRSSPFARAFLAWALEREIPE
jgi:CubicO group peptidase (beta-lactamase class C family)